MIPAEIIFDAFAFVLGAAIGSFLNVVIYRLPRDLSINQPRRSFCPSCQKSIPWYENLPLLSWLVLRGRCRHCGARISFRYFLVELLTAFLFLITWQSFPWPIAISYWIFTAFVIVATFIDFEHFIIPDEITLGGTAAGLVASLIVPQLMNTESRLVAFGLSAGAAALAYIVLWLVLEGGKIVFGKKRVRLEQPAPFTWLRHGDDADLMVGEEKSLWSEFFARENDELLLYCANATVAERQFGDTILRFRYNRLQIGSDNFELDQVSEIHGTVKQIQIPREAMGRGDLKFLASVGAFLGWRAVLFSVFAGSLYGSVVGLLTLVLGKRVWSLKLPFGPYLALGAVTWMFFGEFLQSWYQALITP